MNQEELDALIQSQQEQWDEEVEALPQAIAQEELEQPFVLDEKHKVLKQLDAVIKDSESKAMEVFEELENIQNKSRETSKNIQEILNYAIRQSEVFEKLCVKFPNIKIFENAFHETQEIIEKVIQTQEKSNACIQHSNQAMETMQFQDIHRQKIERVISTIRVLTKYMNHLFEGEIDDDKLPPTPKHIFGDNEDEIMSQDEIQTIISSFEKSK